MSKYLPIKDKRIINLIKSYYQNSNNERDLLFFLLAINTGVKVNDLLALNVKDIRGKDRIIFGRKNSKIKKFILINKEIQDLANRLTKGRKNNEPLFMSLKNNRINRTSIYHNFKITCEILGLDNDISVSSLRKTFGFHYYQASKDLSYLQWFFNQSTILETMKYIDINENFSLRFNSSFSL